MKVLVVVALLLAVCYADMNCWYASSDGTSVYSLEDLAWETNHWMNVTDSNGQTWFWKVCNDATVDNTPFCPTNSSVCIQTKNGKPENRGTTSTAQWSEIDENQSGIEVVFGSDQTCSFDETEEVKTVIDYVCGTGDKPTISIVAKGCFAQIMVVTEEACAESDYDDDMDGSEDGFYYDQDEVETIIITPFLTFGLLLTITVLFTCLCCCCIIRRRRCQKKAIAMRQFSNIAFQPIPSTHSTVNKQQPINQQFPSYNPYVVPQNGQPQFVYYYPGQQMQVPLETFSNQDTQVDSDEKLAKELQSQFDRERV